MLRDDESGSVTIFPMSEPYRVWCRYSWRESQGPVNTLWVDCLLSFFVPLPHVYAIHTFKHCTNAKFVDNKFTRFL